ncbi:MAG: hypothetical protein Q4B91_07740 [Atopobiaceae bacterium]|nr:hypothetical protein [Atopobiaceae bacterium]
MAGKNAGGRGRRQSGRDDYRAAKGERPGSGLNGLRKGTAYLVGSLLIIVALTYLIPQATGLDIRSAMQAPLVLGILRSLVGVGVIVYAVRAVFIASKRCALEGESLGKGFRNAACSVLAGINGLTIILLIVAGISLILWGMSSISM